MASDSARIRPAFNRLDLISINTAARDAQSENQLIIIRWAFAHGRVIHPVNCRSPRID